MQLKHAKNNRNGFEKYMSWVATNTEQHQEEILTPNSKDNYNTETWARMWRGKWVRQPRAGHLGCWKPAGEWRKWPTDWMSAGSSQERQVALWMMFLQEKKELAKRKSMEAGKSTQLRGQSRRILTWQVVNWKWGCQGCWRIFLPGQWEEFWTLISIVLQGWHPKAFPHWWYES